MSDVTTMNRTEYVTAFFDSEADAEAAVARIEAEGIPRDQIRMVAGAPMPGPTGTRPSRARRASSERLADLFMPEEDRYAYAEGLSRGGFLVHCTRPSDNRDRILDILDDEGTVDMDAREESWRAEGWRATRPVSPTQVGAAASNDRSDASLRDRLDMPSEDKIEVVEEKLRVGKRDAEQGRVRVRSYVVETPVEEEVSCATRRFTSSARPSTGRSGDDASAFVDRTIEATETREQAVVSKEARVTEEISLEKAVDARTETVRDTVRHTEVEVEDERLDRDK